jgi:hypothetical protein
MCRFLAFTLMGLPLAVGWAFGQPPPRLQRLRRVPQRCSMT